MVGLSHPTRRSNEGKNLARKHLELVQSSFDIRRPDSHTCFVFFPFCLVGNVALSEYYFCTISAFFLYGEHVVRSFLPNGVLLPCDHGLDFYHPFL